MKANRDANGSYVIDKKRGRSSAAEENPAQVASAARRIAL
jgi:hypothetical protein